MAIGGYIKLNRKLLSWEWYNNSKMVHLFTHLLLIAHYKSGHWQGTAIQRGQVLTGRIKLAGETGMSERTIRTCLAKLVATSEITIQRTNRSSIITICKYDTYQGLEAEEVQDIQLPAVKNDQQNDHQNASQKIQQNDQHIRRNKEVKEIEEVNKENKGENAREEKKPPFENQKMPLGFLMQKMFLEKNPGYPSRPSKDMPAILQIGVFIHEMCGGQKCEMCDIDIGGQAKVLDKWSVLSDWYKERGNNKDLGFIEQFKLQEAFSEIKNGKNGKHNNGRAGLRSVGKTMEFDDP